MEPIFNTQGVSAELVRADLRNSLDQSRSVYWQRIAGITGLWSATTRCIQCGAWWMWGVKDNLEYVCDKCKKA